MLQNKGFFLLIGIVFCMAFFSCKKGGDTAPVVTEVVPEISFQDASLTRSALPGTMRFYINSNKAISNPVSVDYTIADGTATSPKDYTATTGTITIPANQTQATLDVEIKGDATNLRQPNLQFTVQLKNAKLCKIATASANGIILTEDGANLSTDNTGYTTPLTYPGYTLAWSDEFSGNTINTNVWNYETGNGSNGWGNNELEYYTSSTKNSFISNGNLIIEARKEPLLGFNYSSARLTTQNKKSFQFGRIDIRAKLPVGKGIWPALWMLGGNISTVGWPACGEIDMMELIGTYPNRVTGTMHWKPVTGTSASKGADFTNNAGDFSQQFHVFSIVWTKDAIKWYVDDQLYVSNTVADVGSANYPFNADQFFIFNVAVGGQWPGSPDATTAFPQRMFVDYVRVFQ